MDFFFLLLLTAATVAGSMLALASSLAARVSDRNVGRASWIGGNHWRFDGVFGTAISGCGGGGAGVSSAGLTITGSSGWCRWTS